MKKSATWVPVLTFIVVFCGVQELFSFSDSDEVRIRILERVAPSEAYFFVKTGTLHVTSEPDGARLASLRPEEDVRISRAGNRVFVVWADGQRELQAVRLGSERNEPIHIEVRTRAAGAVGNLAYRGSIEVSTAGTAPELMIINHVPVEDYVASVVASEYPFNSMEGAKAQAVVARTYALRTSGRFGPAFDHTDHVASQVYTGALAETDVSRRAAEQTRGRILTHNGEPIEAVYSSTCGGHTASNDDVWDGNALPYLRGRPDPYDGDSPHASWQTTVNRETLLDILSREYGFRVAGILLTDRSADGRVSTVRLLGNRPQNVRANAFRLAVNGHFGSQFLKSTMFDARIEGDDYILEGRGFGHGVGMCQYGAHGQARQGRSYSEILNFYYPGTTLEGFAEPTLVAELPSPDREPVFERDPDTTAADPEADLDESDLEPEREALRPERRPTPATNETPRRPVTRRVGW